MAHDEPLTNGRSGLDCDVLVLGGGPAGLKIASELAGLGLDAALVAPNLGDRWTQSYGDFLGQFKNLGVGGAIVRAFERPLVRGPQGDTVVLDEPYVRLETGYLQTLLFEQCGRAGVRLFRGGASSVAVNDLGNTMVQLDLESGPGGAAAGQVTWSTRAVVDASGLGSSISGCPRLVPSGYQCAYGLWLEVDQHPFAEREMSLMDYRPSSEDGPVTFLYAMPESGEPSGPGTLFVQETCLCSNEVVDFELLSSRLSKRLKGLGIEGNRVLGTERCLIPMGGGLPDVANTVLPFGAAAGLVHPATGYQLTRALRAAPRVAGVLANELRIDPKRAVRAAWEELWPTERRNAWRVYEAGNQAIMEMPDDAMRKFMEDFFSLPTADWLGFMTGSLGATDALRVMWRVFRLAPNDLRLALLKGGSGAAARFLTAKPTEAQSLL